MWVNGQSLKGVYGPENDPKAPALNNEVRQRFQRGPGCAPHNVNFCLSFFRKYREAPLSGITRHGVPREGEGVSANAKLGDDATSFSVVFARAVTSRSIMTASGILGHPPTRGDDSGAWHSGTSIGHLFCPLFGVAKRAASRLKQRRGMRRQPGRQPAVNGFAAGFAHSPKGLAMLIRSAMIKAFAGAAAARTIAAAPLPTPALGLLGLLLSCP